MEDAGPSAVPSARTQMMSSRRRAPLSTRAGVIQTSPPSSRTERLPPEVVVMRYRYTRSIARRIASRGWVKSIVSDTFRPPVARCFTPISSLCGRGRGFARRHLGQGAPDPSALRREREPVSPTKKARSQADCATFEFWLMIGGYMSDLELVERED